MGDTILTIDDNEDEFIERQIKDENGANRALTIDDLDLVVLIKKGDEVEVDCSCDSTFLLATMDNVGISSGSLMEVSEVPLDFWYRFLHGGHTTVRHS